MTPMHVGNVLGRLDGVRAVGDGWMARCPSHEDREPSLSLNIGNDGRLLAKCHAGCPPAAFLEALRIGWKDLWPTQASTTTTTVSGSRAFEIRDEEGHLVAVHYREDRADGKRMWWTRPDGSRGLGGVKVADLPLFGVEFLRDRAGEPVVVVEGEKACLALRKLGTLAVGTVTGASSCPGDAALRPLIGREVTLWPDNDLPGRAHMSKIGIRLATLGGKGISSVAWHAGTPIGHDAADMDEDAVRALLAAAAGGTTAPTTMATLAVLVEATNIKTVPPRWLWRHRLCYGKVTLVEGAPGASKTTVALDVLARATRGDVMPDGVGGGGPVDVLILSAEDDPADTLVPRLRLAGADLARVHFMAGKLALDGNTDEDVSLPDDAIVLRDAINRTCAKVVMVDPLFAYVATGADSHTDHKIRRALGPLHRLAAETGTSIIAIRHHRKSAGGDPMLAGGGSIGIIAAARLALLVARDPDDKGSILLAGVKSNIGAQPPTLKYRLVTGTLPEHPGVEWTRIAWDGVSEKSAGDILAAQAEASEGASARDDAEAFLLDLLEAGPVPAKKVESESRAAGLKWRTVHRAKDKLGIKTTKVGGRFGGDPGWYWSLKMPPSAEDAVSGGWQLQASVAPSAESTPAEPPVPPAAVDDGEAIE